MIKKAVTILPDTDQSPVQQPDKKPENDWKASDGIDTSLEPTKERTATKTMALNNIVEFSLMFKLVDLKAPQYQNRLRKQITGQSVDWSTYSLTRESRSATDSVTVSSHLGVFEMNLDDFVEHFIELLLMRDFKMTFTVKLDSLVTAIKEIICALNPNKAMERVYKNDPKLPKVSYTFKLTQSQSVNVDSQKKKLLDSRQRLKRLILHKQDVKRTVENTEVFWPMLEGLKTDFDIQKRIADCCTAVECVQALSMAQVYRFITYKPLEEFLQRQHLNSNHPDCLTTKYYLEVELLREAVSPQRTDNYDDAKTDFPLNQHATPINYLSPLSKATPVNPNLLKLQIVNRQQTPDVGNSQVNEPELKSISSSAILKETPNHPKIQQQNFLNSQQTPDYRNSQENTPVIIGSSMTIGLGSAMHEFHNEQENENFGAQSSLIGASRYFTVRVPDFETLWISQNSKQWIFQLPGLITFFNKVLPNMEFDKLIERKKIYGAVVLVSTQESSETNLSTPGLQIVGACVVRKANFKGCLEIMLFGIAENRRASKGMRESKYLMHAVKHITAFLNFKSLAACVHYSAVKFFCGCDFHKLDAASTNVATIVKDLNPAQYNYSGRQEDFLSQDLLDEDTEPNVFAMFCSQLVKSSDGKWEPIDEMNFLKFQYNSLNLHSKKLCTVCDRIQTAKYTQSEIDSPPYLPPQATSSKKRNQKYVANGERIEVLKEAINFLGGNTGQSKHEIAVHIRDLYNRTLRLDYIKKWFHPLIVAGVLTCNEKLIKFQDEEYNQWLTEWLQKKEKVNQEHSCKQESDQHHPKEEQIIETWPAKKKEVESELIQVVKWFSESNMTLDLLGTELQKILEKHANLQGPKTLISIVDVVKVFFERTSQCAKYDRAPASLKETMIESLFSFFLQYLQPLKKWLDQPDCIVCDLKFLTQNIQHKQHCFSSNINYRGFSDFGPIIPSDADAKYGQVSELVAMTRLLSNQSDFDNYQQQVKKKKVSTLSKRERKLQEKLKQDQKLQGDNEASVLQQKQSGSYLAAKLCFDWVLFFGTDLIAQQLNATQDGQMGKELFLCIWLMGKENWTKLQESLLLLHPNFRKFEDVAFMSWTQNFALNQIVQALVKTNGCYDLKENGQRPNPDVLNRLMCIKKFLNNRVLIRADYIENFLKHFIPVYEKQKALRDEGEKSQDVQERKYALRRFNPFQRRMKFLAEQCKIQDIEIKIDEQNLIK